MRAHKGRLFTVKDICNTKFVLEAYTFTNTEKFGNHQVMMAQGNLKVYGCLGIKNAAKNYASIYVLRLVLLRQRECLYSKKLNIRNTSCG